MRSRSSRPESENPRRKIDAVRSRIVGDYVRHTVRVSGGIVDRVLALLRGQILSAGPGGGRRDRGVPSDGRGDVMLKFPVPRYDITYLGRHVILVPDYWPWRGVWREFWFGTPQELF